MPDPQHMTSRGVNWRILQKFLDNVISLGNELRSDSDTLSDYVARMNDRDGVIGGNHTMGVGTSDTTKVRLSGTVRYRIDGVEYSQTNLEAAFSNTGAVSNTKYGAWRILIDKLGAITTQSSTAAGTGAQVHESAEQAFASLAQLAITANTVEIGYLTMLAAGAGFTPNTDNPDSGHANVGSNTYYNNRVPRIDNGFTAAPSVGLSEGDSGNEDEYAYGTINVRTNSVNVAQIAANLNHPFTQADTISTAAQFGGHLIIVDTAGTAIISLPATGILANATQAMTYASAAAAITALDSAQANLPSIFTVIGRIVVDSLKSSFTYNTDKIDGTAANGTGTFTDEVATAFDRTTVSGTGVGPGVPTIPATISAAIPSKSLL